MVFFKAAVVVSFRVPHTHRAPFTATFSISRLGRAIWIIEEAATVVFSSLIVAACFCWTQRDQLNGKKGFTKELIVCRGHSSLVSVHPLVATVVSLTEKRFLHSFDDRLS